MGALLIRRLWPSLVAALFLLGTAVPALAAFVQPSTAACADMASPGMPDCSGSPTKAIACGSVACAGLAVEAPRRVVRTDAVARRIAFPPIPSAVVAGAAWPPEPFPPKPAGSI